MTREVLLAAHILVAVLGVGPVTAMAFMASRSAHEERGAAQYLVLLSRLVQWALVLMLATGLLLARESGWLYMHMTWLQLSLVLFVIIGAGLGLTNRPLRRALREPRPEHFAHVRRFAWFSCAGLAAIIVLMVLKPG